MNDAAVLLFVPGDRPDRFAKALAAGADLVVLDLEDAVAPGDKDAARSAVVEWLGEWLADGDRAADGSVAVRVNAVGDPAHDADLAALAPLGVRLMVPKAEDPAALAALAGRVHPDSRLLALVETAAGVLAAPALAAADRVDRLVLGTFDLAAQLGVSPDDREAMAGARQALVLASAAAGLAGPVDGVTGEVADDDRLRDDLAHATRLGFAGKLCIHPRQVPVARAALAPSADELAWARRVVDAAAGSGAVLLDGRMVDKPVVDRARRLLARAPEEPQTQ